MPENEYTGSPVYNPFSKKDKVDKQTEEYVDNKADTFDKEVTKNASDAKAKARELETEAHNTPKEYLDEGVNDNYAKFGGRWGHINNRDYGRTLRLARRADAYNNAPVAHHVHYGSFQGSGIQDMGVPYDRPKIASMETRAMDQAFELDTNQKRLSQALQDAVNRKDLEAFKNLFAQLYNINLTDYQAKNLMRNFARQQEISSMITMKQQEWLNLFSRWLNADTVTGLFTLSKDNPLLGKWMSDVLSGGPAPDLTDYAAQEITNYKMQKKFGAGWQNYLYKPEYYKMLAETQTELRLFGNKMANIEQYGITKAQSFGNNRKDKKTGKSLYDNMEF